MSTDDWVNLTTPEAQKYAELHGIRADIHGALQYARLAIAQSKELTPLSAMLVEPLVISIVVKYSRVFVHGVRRKLGGFELANLSAQQLCTHEFLKSFRDKHVAHSVNGFEGNITRGRFDKNQPDAGISSIGCVHSKLTGFTDAQLNAVVELCTFWLSYIDGISPSEEKNVMQSVKGLRIEELLATKVESTLALHLVDPKKPR